MHEDSLVLSLLKQIDELVVQRGGGRVVGVRVEAGPLSGIEPALFAEAFRRRREEHDAAEAELQIESVGLSCRCRGCLQDYIVEELRFVCPLCGGDAVDVIGGDTVVLKSFTLLSPAAAEITS